MQVYVQILISLRQPIKRYFYFGNLDAFNISKVKFKKKKLKN